MKIGDKVRLKSDLTKMGEIVGIKRDWKYYGLFDEWEIIWNGEKKISLYYIADNLVILDSRVKHLIKS